MVKRVVVIGFKGGSGKTTIASLITRGLIEIGEHVGAVDLDYANPCFAKYLGLNIMWFEDVLWDVISNIDVRKCNWCLKCATMCPEHCIIINPNLKKIVLVLEKCIGCKVCEDVCESKAIVFTHVKVGEIGESVQVSKLHLYTFKATSEKLVRCVIPWVVCRIEQLLSNFSSIRTYLYDTRPNLRAETMYVLKRADKIVCVVEESLYSVRRFAESKCLLEELGENKVVYVYNKLGKSFRIYKMFLDVLGRKPDVVVPYSDTIVNAIASGVLHSDSPLVIETCEELIQYI